MKPSSFRRKVETRGGASPTDVLRTAALLAQSVGGELHLLRVVDPPVGPMEGTIYTVTLPRLLDGSLEEAREEMRKAMTNAAAFTRGKVFAHTSVGAPACEILDLASALEVDVIVVGHHTRGPLARLVIGSVTERVVRQAACVVVARPKSYGTPAIEPPCGDCLAAAQASQNDAARCARHIQAHHVHPQHDDEAPPAFALGSMLIRPPG